MAAVRIRNRDYYIITNVFMESALASTGWIVLMFPVI